MSPTPACGMKKGKKGGEGGEMGGEDTVMVMVMVMLTMVVIVVKNPLAPVEYKAGAGINCEMFELGLEQFVVCSTFPSPVHERHYTHHVDLTESYALRMMA